MLLPVRAIRKKAQRHSPASRSQLLTVEDGRDRLRRDGDEAQCAEEAKGQLVVRRHHAGKNYKQSTDAFCHAQQLERN